MPPAPSLSRTRARARDGRRSGQPRRGPLDLPHRASVGPVTRARAGGQLGPGPQRQGDGGRRGDDPSRPPDLGPAVQVPPRHTDPQVLRLPQVTDGVRGLELPSRRPFPRGGFPGRGEPYGGLAVREEPQPHLVGDRGNAVRLAGSPPPVRLFGGHVPSSPLRPSVMILAQRKISMPPGSRSRPLLRSRTARPRPTWNVPYGGSARPRSRRTGQTAAGRTWSPSLSVLRHREQTTASCVRQAATSGRSNCCRHTWHS